MSPPPVCGRFAPSPTGSLHFGSLVAALGSLVNARRRGGRWLVRIAVDTNERKLGKQNPARPIASDPPGAVLVDALEFLGQSPPRELARARPAEVISWAIGNWDRGRVPRRRIAPAPGYAGDPRLRSCLQ